MYVPAQFKLEDRERIRELVDANRFAILVGIQDGVPLATHLPLLYDPAPGPYGTLHGHVARANPHWRIFPQSEALAIFPGPHAYVSPTWYRAGVPAVPTWNYVTVHAYGRPRIVEDPERVYELLRRLSEREESRFAEPWSIEGLDSTYLEHMTAQIVAFEIPVTRLEAKAKLSQNRAPDERRRVAAALGGEMAELMEKLAP